MINRLHANHGRCLEDRGCGIGEEGGEKRIGSSKLVSLEEEIPIPKDAPKRGDVLERRSDT